jgi:hypothetical protein
MGLWPSPGAFHGLPALAFPAYMADNKRFAVKIAQYLKKACIFTELPIYYPMMKQFKVGESGQDKCSLCNFLSNDAVIDKAAKDGGPQKMTKMRSILIGRPGNPASIIQFLSNDAVIGMDAALSLSLSLSP